MDKQAGLGRQAGKPGKRTSKRIAKQASRVGKVSQEKKVVAEVGSWNGGALAFMDGIYKYQSYYLVKKYADMT